MFLVFLRQLREQMDLKALFMQNAGLLFFSVTTSQMAYQRGIRQEFIPHFLETAYRNEKNFTEVLNLPYSYFLLLNRESWIASYQASKEGREILRNLWRLQQEKADEKAVSDFIRRRQ